MPAATLGGAVAMAADADALVKEGIALRRQGKDLAALKKFEEANTVQESPRTLAQIGLAEQALGRWGAADRHLRGALSATDDGWISKNRKLIEQALKIVGQHVGQLEIVGSPVGSEVLVDGEVVGRLPLGGAVAATAGGVAVEVRAPGYVPVVRSAQIAVGGLTRESFNLQSTAPQPTTGDAAARNDRANPPASDVSAGANDPVALATNQPGDSGEAALDPSAPSVEGRPETGAMPPARIAALVAAGLSVGALALGVYEHLQWQDRVSSFKQDDACDLGAPGRGSPACQSLYESGEGSRTLAFVGYGVAGAFAATAVVLYLVSPEPSPAPRPVACGLQPGTYGLTCAGRF